GSDRILYGAARRAVMIVEYAGPLEQLPAAPHRLESLGVDEVIIASADLVRPRRPRRHRDRQRYIGIAREQPARQRGLAGARRRREDEHHAASRNRVRAPAMPPLLHRVTPDSGPARGTVPPHF